MMAIEALESLNEKIQKELAGLPATDPLTLGSGHRTRFDSDTPVREIIQRICSTEAPPLRGRLESEYFESGPLGPLFSDDEVTEIILNGPRSIWFEKRGRLHAWSDRFLSPLTYRNFISRVSRESGMQASLDCPFADGVWKGARVHLIVPPVSGDHAVLTFRRHPVNPWSLERLQENSWATLDGIRKLEALVSNRKNFLIVGSTGSGKTSVLNACLAKSETNERAVIIEDTDELRIPNAASCKLLTRRDPLGHLRTVDQSELLRQALRMRPDRLIMGEIRSGEAKDLLMAFATGHSGCMGTLHADSPRQALLRLEMLIQLGAPQWSLQAVRTLIWLSVQAVVVVGRAKDGARRLEGIYEIASLEDVGFLIEKTH